MNVRRWRFVIVVAMAAVVLASACQPLAAPPGEDQTAANVELVRSNFLEAWNNFDLSAVDAAFAEEYVGHLPGMEVEGIEGHKGLISTFLTAFPDWTFTIDEQWAFDDIVVTRWSVTGTHEDELMGIPPTHQAIDVTGTDVHRIENGKVVEAWVEFNQLLMMEQIGFELTPATTGPEASAPAAVETVLTFDAEAGELPEGIAVDEMGNTYFSLRPLGQVWRISREGETSMMVEFAESVVGGLAVDANGDLYVAIGSDDPEINGIVSIALDGAVTHVPGSEGMALANALTFDETGTLYASESIDGCVWRTAADGTAELWLEHESLLGTEALGFGIPIGANGIAYYDGTIYVANSEQNQIVAVPVEADGAAGEPQVVVPTEDLVFDGIAMSEDGHIYALAIAQSQLLRLDPSDGSMTVLATYEDGLDWPASLAFGRGDEANTVFLTNLAIGPEGGMGPAVLKVDVGEPGYLLQ